jgi:APA family basic amino acid/polyamine antiporter
VQNLFMFLKLAGLAALIVATLLAPPVPPVADAVQGGIPWSRFGVAMIACLWTYKGWQTACLVVGEMKNPERNVPRSLAIGVGLVTALYLLANIGYLHVMNVSEIAGSTRVAATAAERAMGSAGATFVTLAILASIIGAANGGILATPRLMFAQAVDGLLFRRLAAVHPRFETPHVSVVAYTLWAGVLVATGSFQTLFSYVIFTAWIFYGMTVAAVMILRRRRPDAPRPYRMWGYPWTAILFIVVTAWFVANTILTTPVPSLLGLLLVVSGAPVYYFLRTRLTAGRD